MAVCGSCSTDQAALSCSHGLSPLFLRVSTACERQNFNEGLPRKVEKPQRRCRAQLSSVRDHTSGGVLESSMTKSVQ